MKPSQAYLDKLKDRENRARNPLIHDPKRSQGGFDPTIGYGYSLNEKTRKLPEVNADFRKAGIPPFSPTEWSAIQRGEYHRVDRSLTEQQMSSLLDVTVSDYGDRMKTAASSKGVNISRHCLKPSRTWHLTNISMAKKALFLANVPQHPIKLFPKKITVHF